MSRFGKPDRTGRSSGEFTSRDTKLYGPPKGEPWTWQTLELMCSPAWRAMSVNTRRLVDFLQVEHRQHAARENGNLKATYDGLVAHGLTRSKIRPATEEAEFLGLIRFERGGRWAGTNQPSRFRLTFYADKDRNPPTNEWKAKTQEVIDEWMSDRERCRRARRRSHEKQIPSTTSRTTVVPLRELRNRSDGKRR